MIEKVLTVEFNCEVKFSVAVKEARAVAVSNKMDYAELIFDGESVMVFADRKWETLHKWMN